MTTVSPYDIEKLHNRVTETAVNVASIKATQVAQLKQTDKVVELLQGNGQPGLVGKVAEVKVRVRNCELELAERKQNNQSNRRATTGWIVAAALGVLAGLLAFI